MKGDWNKGGWKGGGKAGGDAGKGGKGFGYHLEKDWDIKELATGVKRLGIRQQSARCIMRWDGSRR